MIMRWLNDEKKATKIIWVILAAGFVIALGIICTDYFLRGRDSTTEELYKQTQERVSELERDNSELKTANIKLGELLEQDGILIGELKEENRILGDELRRARGIIDGLYTSTDQLGEAFDRIDEYVARIEEILARGTP